MTDRKAPGFADSFWTGDYAGGLDVLFGKLQQGCVENQQVLTVARMRADAEDIYGRRLGDIAPTTDRMAGGFAKDDGASLRKAFEGVRSEMEEAAKVHKKIASNISELVVVPFSRWCESHEARVENSRSDLQARVKAHDKQREVVEKLRSQYFNKCRQVEDLEEESKLAFQAPEEKGSPKMVGTPTIKVTENDEPPEAEPLDIGDNTYSPEQVKQIITHMLSTIKLRETKVPILGTYQNVSIGSDIVEYIQKDMGASSVSYAERIGQDLVDHGFLRLIGNVGKTFANSSRMSYQWRPKAFQISGIPEKKKALDRVSSLSSSYSLDSPSVGSVGEMLSGWNPLNNPYPNETPIERLRRESGEADDRYKIGVRKLDTLRCNLEEAMIDHFKFMERCELDRLKAIKSVMLDFSGAMSNVIPSLQSNVDNMMLYQETVQPLGDLRYLLENYRTGGFTPKVQVYDNYYNKVDEETFGVDLEARARADRKRVPIIVTSILTFLDNHYPDLEGDEARRSIWIVDVPLAATHHLRNALNTGKAVSREVLERYEIPIVASVLKLYLLELPDSLVSSTVYEIIRTIYTSPTTTSSSPQSRIPVLQNTLGQLRLANIATLDALTTHFTRLIELTSADETFVSSLATTLSPCILRPRVESPLTSQERHAYKLIRDLFDHKEAIFGELKRSASANARPSHLQNPQNQTHNEQSTNTHRPSPLNPITLHDTPMSASSSTTLTQAPFEDPSSTTTNNTSDLTSPTATNRNRQLTDESHRRENMEARNRAIASRSRAPSPQPLHNRHRRDRSSGPVPGAHHERFPIASSASNTPDRGGDRSSGIDGTRRGSGGRSLQVPNAEAETSQATDDAATIPMNGTTTAHHHVHDPPSTTTAVAKRESRDTAPSSSSTTTGGRFPLRKPPPNTTATGAAAAAAAAGGSRVAGLIANMNAGGEKVGNGGNRDSVGSIIGGGGAGAGGGAEGGAGTVVERRGVSLEDKPMDDD